MALLCLIAIPFAAASVLVLDFVRTGRRIKAMHLETIATLERVKRWHAAESVRLHPWPAPCQDCDRICAERWPDLR